MWASPRERVRDRAGQLRGRSKTSCCAAGDELKTAVDPDLELRLGAGRAHQRQAATEDVKRDLRTGAERAKREATQATQRLDEPPAV